MSSFYIPKYNCVFIHIPKTAGSSIRNGFFNQDYIGPYYRFPYKYKQLYSFAFVRNPYDRLISAYNFFHIKKLETDHYKELKLSFDQFLKIAIDDSIGYRECSIHNNIPQFIRHHTIPQTHDFHQLRYAKFIGRYEHIDTDWQKVCQDISADYRPLDKNNVSKKIKWYDKWYQKYFPEHYKIRFYKKYFNSNNLDIINTFFDEDFTSLGYEKIKALP
jgi:chondroitin 4-sulfotransferase 11